MNHPVITTLEGIKVNVVERESDWLKVESKQATSPLYK